MKSQNINIKVKVRNRVVTRGMVKKTDSISKIMIFKLKSRRRKKMISKQNRLIRYRAAFYISNSSSKSHSSMQVSN